MALQELHTCIQFLFAKNQSLEGEACPKPEAPQKAISSTKGSPTALTTNITLCPIPIMHSKKDGKQRGCLLN
jgi:hypothetical protein